MTQYPGDVVSRSADSELEVPGTGSPRVPNWVVAALAAVVLASTAVLVVGAVLVGATWDEKTQVLKLQTYFAQGWNVSPDALLNGAPDPSYIWGIYVYGPVANLIGHAVNVAMGAEHWGTPVLTAQAYVGRHLGTALIAVLAVAAVAWTVRVVTRSWRWALVGAGMLAAVPLWIGHGMFNIKDLPVASGYAVATAGAVMIILRGAAPSARSRVAAVATIAVGTILAVGTRAATGFGITVGVLLAVLFAWILGRRTGDRDSWTGRLMLSRIIDVVIALVVSYLALLVVYPKAFGDPLTLALEAIHVSARFPFNEPTLTAGQWMDQPPPWTYLPLWFGGQIPVVVLIPALAFVLWWLVAGVRTLLRGRADQMGTDVLLGALPVLAQMLLLPSMAIVGRSNMYNGSRQFLFVVPALAVLATLALFLWVRWLASRRSARPVALVTTWIVLVLGLVAPVVSGALLLPYTYVYYNEVAVLRPIDGNWPTDYWRASGRELVERLPAEGPESCSVVDTLADVQPCLDEPQFTPYASLRGTNAKTSTLGSGQYYLLRENQGVTALPDSCTLLDEITRPLMGRQIVIGQVAVCDTVP